MIPLTLGLVLFLGMHSVRIFADDWRTRQRTKLGDGPWKGLYSVVSAVGIVLIIWGYGLARADPIPIWSPPVWTRHVASLLTLFAFVLLAAAYVPRNAIKAKVQHPMVVGVKVWAFAHLLANGTVADVLLFGAFLVWAVLAFRSMRQRDRAAGKTYPPGQGGATAIAVVVGGVAWAVFALWLHAWWIGVAPFSA
jgi:uncharacterized membrane protein